MLFLAVVRDSESVLEIRMSNVNEPRFFCAHTKQFRRRLGCYALTGSVLPLLPSLRRVSDLFTSSL
jgi:hypothetical protein